MTLYKARKGVWLNIISGEYVLVAESCLRGICPYVTLISESSAYLWNQLQEEKTLDQLTEAVKAEYEIDSNLILNSEVEDYIQKMLEMKYIVCRDTGDENEKEF